MNAEKLDAGIFIDLRQDGGKGSVGAAYIHPLGLIFVQCESDRSRPGADVVEFVDSIITISC